MQIYRKIIHIPAKSKQILWPKNYINICLMDKKFGRRSRLPYRGEALIYLLKKLPNHGVGRLLIRGSIKQEVMKPTYMRILKVDMTPIAFKKKKKKNRNIPGINVVVEKTHAGLTIPKEQNIKNVSHLQDYLLVPEEEEEKYLKNSVAITEPKGHYHLSSSLRSSINKLVEEGMSLVEARQMVIERQKARGVEAVEGDNYDEELEDDDDVDEYGNLMVFADDARQTDSNTNNETGERPQQQHSSRNINNSGRSEEEVAISLEEDEIGDFTEVEIQRVENMVRNGVSLDTARQLEWERKIALKNINILKRDMPRSHWTNASNGGKKKISKI